MPDNNYPPLLNEYSKRLISFTARKASQRGRFLTGDEDDFAQELTVCLLNQAHHFDPSRGSPSTFTDRVVKNRLREILRNERRLKRGGSQHVLSLCEAAPDDGDRTTNYAETISDTDLGRRVGRDPENHITVADRRADIGVAFGLLSPEFRDLWVRLAGKSEASVARDLGVSRRAIRSKKAILRQELERIGLGRD